MNTIDCGWCRAKTPAVAALSARDHHAPPEGADQIEHHYAECPGCGALLLLDGATAQYGDTYYSMGGGRTGWRAAVVRSIDQGAIVAARWVPWALPNLPTVSIGAARLSRSTALLDVGCGHGALLDRLATVGYTNLKGCDPYATHETSASGQPILPVALDQVEGEFEAIVVSHALEHTDDPLHQLELAACRLKPGGTLIVRVPIAGSFASRRYGRYWSQLDAPRHRAVPTVKSVAGALDSAGFEIVRRYFESGHFQFWASRLYRSGGTLAGSGVYSRPSAGSRIAWGALGKLLNVTKRGDAVCFVARKP